MQALVRGRKASSDRIEILAGVEAKLPAAAAAMEGFSGREIAKFLAAVQAAVYGSAQPLLTAELWDSVLARKLHEHSERKAFSPPSLDPMDAEAAVPTAHCLTEVTGPGAVALLQAQELGPSTGLGSRFVTVWIGSFELQGSQPPRCLNAAAKAPSRPSSDDRWAGRERNTWERPQLWQGAKQSLLVYGDRSSFHFYHRDQPAHTPTLIFSLQLPGQPGQPADLTTPAGVKATCRAFHQHYSDTEPTGVYAAKPVDTATRATLLGSLASHLTPTQARAAEGPDGWARLSCDIILPGGLHNNVRMLAASAANTRKHGAPFRHMLFYDGCHVMMLVVMMDVGVDLGVAGPPGTGKTMAAKRLARTSGLDYAIMSGGDVAPLEGKAVTQLHQAFDWAERSSKGLLLFIDEADAFLGRRSDAMSEGLRGALNALLFRTGDQSKDFMVVIATNRPGDLDDAVLDRMDEALEFALPREEERLQLLRLYLDK
ncbi:hypothetical protein QJQ45_008747 [Haematococcus lacustris]|nr:hypothetical protein QJQ45_008747 [Haematococcus lacustris]